MAKVDPRWLTEQLLRAFPAGPAKLRLHTGPPVTVRACQGISPEMAAELADGLRQLVPPAVQYGPGELLTGPVGTEPGSEGWRYVGTTDPTPWADPGHDVLADLRKNALMGPWPHRTFHCATDVALALGPHLPTFGDHDQAAAYDRIADEYAVPELFGIDIIPDRHMQPGRWELRQDGIVIDSGRLEGL